MPVNIDELAETMKLSYMLGEQTYKTIKNGRPENTDIIITPKHIGETIYLCSLISEYKRQHACRSVLMVALEAHKGFIHMFPDVDMVLSIDNVTLESLQTYICIEELWVNEHILYAHARGAIVIGRKGVVFRENFGHSSMLYNAFDYLNISLDSVPRRMNFPFVARTYDLFEKYGNAVLLMPEIYPYSIDAVPMQFWNNISKKMSERGYRVFQYFRTKGSRATIEAAAPISVGYEQLIMLSRYFKGFIGTRSGICDLIAETNGKLFAIYPCITPVTGIKVADSILEQSNLYDLGRTEGIWNYQYSPELEQELVREIISQLE